MKRWGWVITGCYAAILAGFVWPGAIFLADKSNEWGDWWKDSLIAWTVPWCLVPLGLLLVGQALLIFLAVDTSERKLKPRTHVLLSAALGVFLTLWLLVGAGLSLVAGIFGDKMGDGGNGGGPSPLKGGLFLMGLWLVWAVLFYVYSRQGSDIVEYVVKWLLRGSVLGLLIAVPCHVIARRRNDCSAPVATGFGIASGIAIMLMAFGPGILWAYKRRLEEQARKKVTAVQAV